MIKVIQNNSIFIFLIITLAALVGVLQFRNIPLAQFQTLVVLSFLYLGWAIIHHYLDRTLNLEVTIEYMLTALLAIVILYGILI